MTRTALLESEWRLPWFLTAAALAALLAAARPAAGEFGYSYLRTVEGYVSVESAEDGSSFEATENQPLIPGDVVITGTNSRVELALSDGALVRVGDRTDLRLESLAWTPDTGDTSTRLVLIGGELQIVLGRDGATDGLFEVECGNATVYLESPGEYRVTANGYDSSEVVVRDGVAQVQTDRSSAILRAGEAGFVEGAEWASVDVGPADRLSRLETWGDELDAEARLAAVPYVEPQMRYRAARMANYGSWIEVDARRGWRPYVSAGWRPYTDGSWVYTPSGLTWIASEPWGWVPAHYGSWELVPGYGWVWFAGPVYTPASVYWYWGPTHVAWVPAGYYTSFYAPRRYTVPRLGVYGWAGGDWGFFAEWTFCPVRYFGRARDHEYYRSGFDVGRNASYREVPRGVIATDTRGLRRDVWGQPERITARLTAADTRPGTRGLPDVTDFVARRREVSPDVAAIVRPVEAASVRPRSTPQSVSGAGSTAISTRGRATLGRFDGATTPSSGVLPRQSTAGATSATAPRREVPSRATLGRPTFDRGTVESRSAAPSGRPTFDRGTVESRPAAPSGRPVIERPRPGVEPQRYSSPSVEPQRYSSPGASSPRPSFGSLRSLPPSGDDGSVARRVIEQMRTRQLTAPVAPPRPSSTILGPPRGSTPPSAQRPPVTSTGTVRPAPPPSATSRGSVARPEPPRSQSSRSQSSSSPPPRQAPRSRSSGGKPPAD